MGLGVRVGVGPVRASVAPRVVEGQQRRRREVGGHGPALRQERAPVRTPRLPAGVAVHPVGRAAKRLTRPCQPCQQRLACALHCRLALREGKGAPRHQIQGRLSHAARREAPLPLGRPSEVDATEALVVLGHAQVRAAAVKRLRILPQPLASHLCGKQGRCANRLIHRGRPDQGSLRRDPKEASEGEQSCAPHSCAPPTGRHPKCRQRKRGRDPWRGRARESARSHCADVPRPPRR